MCCISLACQLHRDTSRVFDQCLDKLQRGACSKNTVRLIKNDPDLTCAQCLIRVPEPKAPLPSEHISCDGEGRLLTTGHYKNDLDMPWTEENLTEKLSPAHLQPSASVPPTSRPVSVQFESCTPGYPQPEDLESAELSHEDGLRLIDDMYSAQGQNLTSSDCMDTNDDGLYFAWEDSHYELEKVQKRTMEIADFVHNDGDESRSVSIIAEDSPNQSLDHSFSSDGSDTWDETDVGGHTIGASDMLQQTKWKLETFQHARGEMEQKFLWCVDEFEEPMQISIEGGEY